nr:MAG TPA: stabilization protein [Bacteriophage sp.]
MLETRINIDGRYDRNRGQSDNTNMSPINFNLLNPVYSQRDNFFSYFMLDDDYYRLNQFPN